MISDTIQSMNTNLKNAFDKITDNDRRNLLDIDFIKPSWVAIDIVKDNKSIVINGTATEDTFCDIGTFKPIENEEYTISCNDTNNNVQIYVNSNLVNGNTWVNSNSRTFTSLTNNKLIVSLFIRKGTTVNTILKPQVELGVVATQYQPYLPPKNLSNLSTTLETNINSAFDKVLEKGGSLRTKNLLDNEKIIISVVCGYGSVNIAPSIDYNKPNRATILPDNAIECLPNTKYTLIIPNGYRVAVGFLTENKIGLGDTGWQTSSTYTFTTKPNSKYIACNFSLVSDGAIDNSIKYQPFMIALGENVEYQPYELEKNLTNLIKAIDSIPTN